MHEGITVFPICNDAASATWMKKTDLRIGGGGPHYKLRNFAKNLCDPAERQVLMTVLAKTSPSLFDLAAGTIYNSLHCKLTPTNLRNSLENILPNSVIDKLSFKYLDNPVIVVNPEFCRWTTARHYERGYCYPWEFLRIWQEEEEKKNKKL